jgi:hypothetical protein
MKKKKIEAWAGSMVPREKERENLFSRALSLTFLSFIS